MIRLASSSRYGGRGGGHDARGPGADQGAQPQVLDRAAERVAPRGAVAVGQHDQRQVQQRDVCVGVGGGAAAVHVAVVGPGRAVGEGAEQPGHLGRVAAAVAAQVQDEPAQLGVPGQAVDCLQHLVCRAGEEPGQLHVGDVSVQELCGHRRRGGLVERRGQGHRPGAAGGGPVQPHHHPAWRRVGAEQQVHDPCGDDAAGERRRSVDRDDDVPGPHPVAGGGGSWRHRGDEQRRQRLLRRGIGQRRRR